jgi:hypothetical protein
MVNQTARISKAFPALKGDFIDILQKRVKELGFGNQRITDCINHVIDTCPYPNPSIANFVSFDKRIKLHTYNDMCDMVSDYGKSIWDDYKAIRVPGLKKIVYVLATDIEVYNLQAWEVKQK